LQIKAIVFDVNGTLVDIQTDEHSDRVFRALGHFLTYQGIDLRRQRLRELYPQYLKEQQRASAEHHPEYDAVAVWRRIVEEHASEFTRSLPEDKRAQLPVVMAEMHRAISRRRLRPDRHVLEVLDALGTRFPLAVVSDGQSSFARAELHKVGLLEHFAPVVISGDHGFRKPDRRLFQTALDALGVNAENTLYVGNDMYRDVHGAARVGMRTVLFASDQGRKHYRDRVPDFTISDHRELLTILGV
jgi:putative hydrolase of the HAD superfamily